MSNTQNELEQLVEVTTDADTTVGGTSDSINNNVDEEEPDGRRKDEHQESQEEGPRFSQKKQIIVTIVAAIFVLIIIVLPFAVTKGKDEEQTDERKPPKFTPPDKIELCLGKTSSSQTACEELINKSPLKDIADDLLGYSICPCYSDDRCCNPDEKAFSWMMADKFNGTLYMLSENERNTRLRVRSLHFLI